MLVLDAIMGRATPRVPVAPLVNLGHASRLAGLKPLEYLLDSNKYSGAQLNAKHHYGYDWAWVHQFFGGITKAERDSVVYNEDHAILTLEAGVKYKITDRGQPKMVKAALTEPNDVKNFKIPDPKNEERLEPIRLMREEEGFLSGNMRCPFTLASTFLYELEPFLMLLKTDEEAAFRILDHALDYCVQYAQAQVEAGVDAMYVEDPVASNNVISPTDYRKYAHLYEKKLIEEIDAPVVLHICGDVNTILDDMITTGADCISVDEVMDLEKVHKKIPVWGNVPIPLLVNGNPSSVEEACKTAIDLKTGVVLSSGCVVPANAKEENIKTMVGAVHGN